MLYQTPRLSIVIATYNGADKIQRCLASLLDQADKHGVQVIVVVDGSTDDTEEVLNSLRVAFPSCLEVCVKNHAGPSAARNHGALLATAEWLLFLDDDTVPPVRFLPGILSLLEHPPADLMSFQDRPLPDDGYLPKSFRFLELASRRTLGRARALKGAALLCRHTTFDEVHGFDADRGYYFGEDADLVERARAHGQSAKYLLEPSVCHQSPKLREYLRKSALGLHLKGSIADRRYFRVEETVIFVCMAVGALGSAKRHPRLKTAGPAAAVVLGVGAGTLVTRLAGARLIFIPGITLAIIVRLPFVIFGSLIYSGRAYRTFFSRIVSKPPRTGVAGPAGSM